MTRSRRRGRQRAARKRPVRSPGEGAPPWRRGNTSFTATDPTNGTELWISDGTEAGTHLLKDINTAPGDSPYPNGIAGRGGADTLYGFVGNDIYSVDNVGDHVVEAADTGTDRVVASVSYSLEAGQSVEFLGTTDATGTTAIALTGNETAQTVIGNAGANRLDGKGSAETLYGLGSDDTYTVDNAADRIVEVANAGTDRVVASVSYTLGAGGPTRPSCPSRSDQRLALGTRPAIGPRKPETRMR